MSGSKIGGLKAAETNRKKYGENFYIKLGSKGGTQTYLKGKLIHGFKKNDEHTRAAGRLGGKISKRGPAKRV